jgi:integrase/recombinase XerD
LISMVIEHTPAVLVVEAASLAPAAGGLNANRSGVESDAALVALFLETKRSAHTRRAYAGDLASFLEALAGAGRSLRSATVADVSAWVSRLEGAPASRARRVSAVKSLLTFGAKTGYLAFNVGAVVDVPAVPNDLAERILTEVEAKRIITAAGLGRDGLMVRFLYASGARVSEACSLRWSHVHVTGPDRRPVAFVTLHGKGGKTRHVAISSTVTRALVKLRNGAPDDAFVFATASGGPLHPANVAKVVRAAARDAGVKRAVSPHWLRHAHASHALDRGAPVSLVQASLGHASLATTGRYTHAKPNDGAGLYLAI